MIAFTPAAELAAFTIAALPLGRVLSGRALPPGAGAMVMALGIFGLAVLPALPGGGALRQPLALCLLVLWAVLAWRFIAQWRAGQDPRWLPPMARFGAGTWIAATAVTAALLSAAVPSWRLIALPLIAAALGLWVVVLPLAATAARELAAEPRQPVTGTVLLVTVAIQSTALLDAVFSHPPAFPSLMLALVVLGAACYAAGVVLMARAWLSAPRCRLDEDWDNGNCILHGAISITGLAAVLSGAAPASACHALWLFAALMFAVVETVEIARLVQRMRRYGWRRGVFTYDASQWARNFTFGMFDAFTRASLRDIGAAPPHALAALQHGIAAGGPYVVTVLLMVEIGLLLAAWRGGEV